MDCDSISADSHAKRARLVGALYIASALVVSVQRGVFGFANDFAIFRAASLNLRSGHDLYILHPTQALDLFKYSPSFALLFTPIALLPPLAGLLLWNVLGAVALCLALWRLLPPREAVAAQLLVYLAFLRNLQSAQSNSLISALVIATFLALESERWWRAAMALGVGAAIKVFPAAAVALALCKREGRRLVAPLVVSGIALLSAPLAVTDAKTFVSQYASWGRLHEAQRDDAGQSVMTIVERMTGSHWPQWLFQLVGLTVLLIPFVRMCRGATASRAVRLQLLASLLVFMVIFNHKAEAESYVIAISGVAVWWASRPELRWRLAGAVAVVALTNLPSTDAAPVLLKAAVPSLWRGAIPCSLLWAFQQWELMRDVSRCRMTARFAEPHKPNAEALEPLPGGPRG